MVIERLYHIEDEFTDDWADVADACAEKWDADAYWAAVALAYLLGQGLPDNALDTLIRAKEHEPLPEFPPGWHQRAQRGYVALALQRVGLG